MSHSDYSATENGTMQNTEKQTESQPEKSKSDKQGSIRQRKQARKERNGESVEFKLEPTLLEVSEFWVDVKEFLELFDNLDMYHEVSTYAVTKTYSDLKDAGTARDRSPANGLYLFTDSLSPLEILLYMEAIPRYHPFFRNTCQTDDGVEANNATKNKSTNETMNSIQFETQQPIISTLTLETSNWLEKKCGCPVKRIALRTNQSFTLSLAPGRHCFRLRVDAPLGYCLTVFGHNRHQTTRVKLPEDDAAQAATVNVEKTDAAGVSPKHPFVLLLGGEDEILSEGLKNPPLRLNQHVDSTMISLSEYISALTRMYAAVKKECDEQVSDQITEATTCGEEALSRNKDGLCQAQSEVSLKRQTLFNLTLGTTERALPVQSVLAVLRMLQKDTSTTPDMNFAWRVMLADTVTKNPLNVSYKPRVNRGHPGSKKFSATTPTSRQSTPSGDKRSAKTSHKPTDQRLIQAAIKIQSFYRGYRTRKILDLHKLKYLTAEALIDWGLSARSHEHVCHTLQRLVSGLDKLGELLWNSYEVKEVKTQSDLTASILSNPSLPFSSDLSFYLLHRDYSGKFDSIRTSGEYTDIDPSPWADLVIRETISSPEATQIVSMQFKHDLPNAELILVDNDTGKLHRPECGPHQDWMRLKTNRDGLTLMVLTWPPSSCSTKWNLRFKVPGVAGNEGFPSFRRKVPNNDFKVFELADYYEPRMKGILFRRKIQSSIRQPLTLHLKLSNPNVPVTLYIKFNDTVLKQVHGRGEVLLHHFILEPLGLPESQKLDVRQRSICDHSKQGTGPFSLVRQKIPKEKDLDKPSNAESEHEDESSYWIEAEVPTTEWPLTYANWAFLEEEHIKQLKQSSVYQNSTEESQSTKPVQREIKRVRNLGQKSRQLNLVEPYSEMDFKQSHWRMRIILDLDTADRFKITKIDDTQAMRRIKQDWEAQEPGRAERAHLSRAQYLESHAAVQKPANVEEASPSKIKETSTERTQVFEDVTDPNLKYSSEFPVELSRTRSEVPPMDENAFSKNAKEVEQERVVHLEDSFGKHVVSRQFFEALCAEAMQQYKLEEYASRASVRNEIFSHLEEEWKQKALEYEKSDRKSRADQKVLLTQIKTLQDKLRLDHYQACEAVRTKLMDEYLREQEKTAPQTKKPEKKTGKGQKGKRRQKVKS